MESLKSDPSAFGSSFEEEETLSEEEWRRRTGNVLFALSEDRPVGMMVYMFGDRRKFSHVAEIFGVYVTSSHRGKGVGTELLEQTLGVIRKNKKIIKVKLSVNPEQRAALRMYRKAGFVVAGRAKNELKVGRRFFDLVQMEKTL